MKKLMSLVLALVLLMSCALAEENTQTQRADLSGYLMILHTNDLGGEAQAGLGLSRVSLAKKRLEQAGAAVLLLDAGNWLSGAEGSWLDQGEGMISLMQEAGYAAAGVGTGEFAYGMARLEELKQTAGEMRLLGDSVTADLFERCAVLEGVAGLKVGLFSVTAQDAASRNPAGATEGCTFEAPLETAQACALALEEQGCDLIVGLCSAGDEVARQFAQQADGIDLILCAGGTAFVGGEWSESGTLLSQAGAGLSSIGCVAIDAEGNATAMGLDESYFEEGALDEALEVKIAEVMEAQESKRNEVIAAAPATLSGEHSDAAQTALGSWAADAVKARTGAQVCLLPGTAVGAQLAAGEVTWRGVLEAFPGGEEIVTTEMTGAQLQALLEAAISAYPEASERFLQVSGLEFSFDAAQGEGTRVLSVAIDGEPLAEDARYVVACTPELAVERLNGYGVLSRLLADALADGQAPLLDQPMEARINSAG